MTARRAVLTAPGTIELQDASDPAPAPGELLIAPDAVGICGTDLELLDGTMAYFKDGKARYPLVPGHEWTGIVLDSQTDGFKAGDRVVGECAIGCGACDRCARGAYHVCVDRSETGLFGRAGAMQTRMIYPARSAHRVPPSVSKDAAVLIEPLAVAYRGLTRVRVPGRVGVLGAGTIGVCSALAARTLGAEDVHLLDTSEGRRDFAQSLGFKVSEARFPLVVEATGSPNGLPGALAMCEDEGVVLVLGLSGETVSVDADDVVVRDISIVGSLSSPGVWPAVVDLLADGVIDPSRLVSHRFGLSSAAEAFRLVRSRAPGVRKVVIDPSL